MTTTAAMNAHETEQYRMLARLLTGKDRWTLCFLIYETREQRDRMAAQLAELLEARATVRFGPHDKTSTRAVRRRLAGNGEKTPVQVLDADRWPEGLKTLAYRLNLAREALPEDTDRAVLVWGSDDDITTFARSSADLWDWRSGVFDFRAPE